MPCDDLPVELPPYATGLRRCPQCGAKSPQLLPVPASWVIPFRPRECASCSYAWTPRSPAILSILYGVFGLGCVASAVLAVVLVPMFILDWADSAQPITWIQVTYTLIWCFGGLISLMLGLACLRLAKQIATQSNTATRSHTLPQRGKGL